MMDGRVAAIRQALIKLAMQASPSVVIALSMLRPFTVRFVMP